MNPTLPSWVIFAIGFLAQIFFTARTLIQWIKTEKAKHTESPSSYWVFSVLGAWTMLFYGVLRDDFAIILGQFFSYYVYLWNLGAKGIWKRLTRFTRLLLAATPIIAVMLLLSDAEAFFDHLFRNSEIPVGLVLFGSAGQIIFTLRFVYQWYYSRQRGESSLPLPFWLISLAGSAVIIAYGIFRKDPVLILGQSFGFVAYIRNVIIAMKNPVKETAPRAKAAPGGGSFITRHPVATALAFSVICLLPTMMMRDFTPSNELRYLSIADEAIREGHIFAFTNHGLEYADKPPLYLWIVMLCRLLAGKHSMFLLSLFSLVPALVTTWVMDRWTRFEDPRKRLASALMLMTSALFMGMSIFLRMDMLMAMFIVLALYSFYLMYSGEGNFRKQSYLLPLWIFLALFTKGPVGLLMPPLVIICFLLLRGKGREIGRYLGFKTWGIIAGLSAVWLLGVYLDGGKSYIENLLFHQTFGRAVNSFHHSEPFWYYLVCIWYVVAPYCFAAIGALGVSLAAFFRKKQLSDKEVLFSTSVVATTVMLSCFSGKLAIYIAPVIPFLIYLFPLVEQRTGWKKWMGPALYVPAAILALVGAALAAVVCFRPARIVGLLGDYAFALSGFTLAAALILTVLSLAGIWMIAGRKQWTKGVACIASGILLSVFCGSMMMPRINDFVGYGKLCSHIPPDNEIVTLRVHRPENTDVYTGRQVQDYADDFERFRKERIDEYDGKPYSLLIREKRASEHPEIMALIEANGSEKVGDFLVVNVTRMPETLPE